ncbi:Uncharacterised protein [Candidatus Tiddalikarchaeum anstoanum]|nr:Uncharacterised protein [Candidatus Tiddalikarchaeum anstoanum]
MKAEIASKPEPEEIIVDAAKHKSPSKSEVKSDTFTHNRDKVISFLRILLLTMLFIVVIFSLLITKMLFSPNPNPWVLFGMIAVMVLPTIFVMAFLFRFLVNYMGMKKD